MEREMDKLPKKLPKSGLKDLNELTKPIAERHRALEFAGFLIREDEDAVYIADVQGTWVIPRDSVTSMFDWDAGHCVPPYLATAGRAVRVGVADGSTIQEIRPWKIVDGKDDSFHRGMRQL